MPAWRSTSPRGFPLLNCSVNTFRYGPKAGSPSPCATSTHLASDEVTRYFGRERRSARSSRVRRLNAAAVPCRDTVVLVHGLWLHGFVMSLMRAAHRALRLSRANVFVSDACASTSTQNAERLARYCDGARLGKVHFVAHSMGGLVALEAAAAHAARARAAASCCSARPSGTAIRRGACSAMAGRARDRSAAASANGWPSRVPAPLDGCEVGVIAGTGGIGLGRLVAPRPAEAARRRRSVEETAFPACATTSSCR